MRGRFVGAREVTLTKPIIVLKAGAVGSGVESSGFAHRRSHRQ